MAITYDLDAETVNVKVTGLEEDAMVSLVAFYDEVDDYLDQYSTDETGALDITYLSSAKWANGGVIKVQIGGGGLTTPDIGSVTIMSDKPYIGKYTKSLTIGFKANVLVEIVNPSAGLSAEITVNGEKYSDAFGIGTSAVVRIQTEIYDSPLTVNLVDGDGKIIDSKPIIVNPMPENMWAPAADISGNDLRVLFAVPVSAAPGGFISTINGNRVAALIDADSSNILYY